MGVSLPLLHGEIDWDEGVARLSGQAVVLRPNELALLRYLAARPHRTVPREELLSAVFGYRPGLRSRTVDTTVHRLRAKIEADPAQPRHLLTDKHIGYRFVPVQPEPALPPAQPTVGREALLERLQQVLAQERVVSLFGPPGAGATHLAAELARRLGASAWLSGPVLAPLPEAGLVVLDAFEGHAADLVRCERALLTARAPLPFARNVEIPPLDPADGAALALWSAEQAGIELSPEHALQLAVRSDGLPLAIRARVERLRALPVAQALGEAPVPALQERLREALEACPPEEQQALAQLAAIRGPFGTEEAMVVLGPAAPERLEALRRRGLLLPDPVGHRLLRDLRPLLCPADPASRWWSWLAEQASNQAEQVDGERAKEALDWLGARLADLDAAARGLEGPEARVRVALARDGWMRLRATVRARRAALEEVAAGVAGALPPELRLAMAAALRAAGEAAGARAELARAGEGAAARVERCLLECRMGSLEEAERAIALARTLPMGLRDSGLLALAEGVLARRQARLDLARDRFHAALGCWQAAGLHRLAGEALVALSTPEILEGRLELAADFLEDAVRRFGAAQDLRNLAPALQHFGMVCGELGRFDEAEAAFRQSLELEEQDGRPTAAANLRLNLAELDQDRGRLAEAERGLREAVSRLQLQGEPGLAAGAQANLALLLWEQDRREPARQLAEEAVQGAASAGRTRIEAYARLIRALALPPEEAREQVALALQLAGGDEAVRCLAVAVRARADGEPERARQELEGQTARSSAARMAMRVL